MKKTILFIIIVSILTVSTACASKKSEDLADAKVGEAINPLIAEYYPFIEDTIFEYTGEGNEFTNQKIFFEFIENNKAQIKVINPGTSLIKLVEFNEGVLKETYSEGEFYHIENIIEMEENMENVLIKEPLIIGNKWTTSDGYSREITSLDREIKTPYDNFIALEVTTDMGDSIQRDYYAKGIGFVGQIFENQDGETGSFLASIKHRPLDTPIQVFYSSSMEDKTVYINDKIYFHTNQSIEEDIADIMKKTPIEGFEPLISQNIEINSIYLDRSSWILKVDFSEDLIPGIEADSPLADKVLKSIVNTLGEFYDVEKVSLTVNGLPYEIESNINIEDGIFEVDLEGIEEYKQ